MKRAFYALGRLPKGTMNKTEKRFEDFIKEEITRGIVAWYKFEAMTLRLAKKTSYTPDFFLMMPNGEMQVFEVKGHKAIFRDDAKVKIKVAAEMFPFRFFVAYPQKTGWLIEEVEP